MGVRGRPLKVNFAYQQIADEIEAQIIDGTLQPGERLPGELELAELFGVTRSTVREGLRQLESDGLVHRPTPRRLEVALPQVQNLTTRASRAMSLMKVTFRELWQVALETEPAAAALAAQFADEADIDALTETHELMQAALEDEAATIELDTRFHSQIAIAGKNRVLELAREPIALLLYQGFAQIAPRVPQAASRQLEAHGHILDSIRARDPHTAREWTRRHIEDFWRAIKIAQLEDKAPIADPRAISWR